jgi:hypothetical protein
VDSRQGQALATPAGDSLIAADADEANRIILKKLRSSSGDAYVCRKGDCADLLVIALKMLSVDADC